MRDRALRRGLLAIAKEAGATLKGGGDRHYKIVRDGTIIAKVGSTPTSIEWSLKHTRKKLLGHLA